MILFSSEGISNKPCKSLFSYWMDGKKPGFLKHGRHSERQNPSFWGFVSAQLHSSGHVTHSSLDNIPQYTPIVKSEGEHKMALKLKL